MHDYQTQQEYFISYPFLSDKEMEDLVPKLEDGEYEFECIKAQQAKSQTSGNEMLVLDLKIFNKDGAQFTVRVWIILTPDWAWKVKSYWVCVGHPEMYTGRNSTSDFTKKKGRCVIKNRKDNKGVMRPSVENFINPEDLKSATAKQPVEFNDDIPY